MAAAPSRSEVEARISRLVSPPLARPLLNSIRPSVRLRAEPPGPVPLGRSHLGGSAHVPATFEWPTCRPFYRKWMHPWWTLGGILRRLTGERETPASEGPPLPLTLMAQINLAELPVEVSGRLPSAGHLLFFCDLREEPLFGGADEPSDRWRVLFVPESAQPLIQMPPPHPSPSPSRGLRLESEWLVDVDSASELDETDEWEAVVEYQLGWMEESGPVHRLLGYEQAVQDRVAYDAESMLQNDPKHLRLKGREDEVVARWRLLLQLDSDAELGWEWGDAGRLYFMIRVEDLAALRFDRVQFVSQCY